MSRSVSNHQAGILAAVPRAARYITFSVAQPKHVPHALSALSSIADGNEIVIGVSARLISQQGVTIEGLRPFPRLSGAKVKIPVTPVARAALWCWIRGDDRGAILHRGRDIEAATGDAFKIESVVDGFRHREGRDLTGYIDGTENPKGTTARRTAFVAGRARGWMVPAL